MCLYSRCLKNTNQILDNILNFPNKSDKINHEPNIHNDIDASV